MYAHLQPSPPPSGVIQIPSYANTDRILAIFSKMKSCDIVLKSRRTSAIECRSIVNPDHCYFKAFSSIF